MTQVKIINGWVGALYELRNGFPGLKDRIEVEGISDLDLAGEYGREAGDSSQATVTIRFAWNTDRDDVIEIAGVVDVMFREIGKYHPGDYYNPPSYPEEEIDEFDISRLEFYVESQGDRKKVDLEPKLFDVANDVITMLMEDLV